MSDLITPSALRPADIIVSTTNAAISVAIRAGIGSSVSHSMIYIGGGFVVEAVDAGVVRNPLTDALSGAVLGIALRRRNLTAKQRAAVIENALRFKNSNLPYDKIGAAGSGSSLPRGGLLSALACTISLEFCPIGIAGVAANAAPGNADKAFFCSELVARCFELAGAPVVDAAPSFTTPRQIRMATALMKVGKLVDTPPT